MVTFVVTVAIGVKMTSGQVRQVVEKTVNVIKNGPSQDYIQPHDHTLPTYDRAPGFRPFPEFTYMLVSYISLQSNLSLLSRPIALRPLNT